MTQEEAREAIEIMKAFADGKEVEYKPRYGWSQWAYISDLLPKTK